MLQFFKDRLSNREQEIASEVLSGDSNAIIAARQFITIKTVKFHLTNIYRKLGISSRAQLIVLAQKNPNLAPVFENPTLPAVENFFVKQETLLPQGNA